MRINMKRDAVVKKYCCTHNDANDIAIREAELHVDLTRDEMAQIFDRETADIAFAGYTTEVIGHEDGDETEGVWKTAEFKPNKKVVCENHVITINEYSFVGQPKVVKFVPRDGQERMTAVIRVCLSQSHTRQRATLEAEVGSCIELTLRPSQSDLPGF